MNSTLDGLTARGAAGLTGVPGPALEAGDPPPSSSSSSSRDPACPTAPSRRERHTGLASASTTMQHGYKGRVRKLTVAGGL